MDKNEKRYIKKYNKPALGILFVLLFAALGIYLAQLPFLSHAGISPLIIAILLGMFYTNTLRQKIPIPSDWLPGIQFSAKKLLRLAIVLYGFRISWQQIASIGIAGVLLDLLVVISTLLFGLFVGIKLLKLDRQLAWLISIGGAICGAAAVLAAEDVLKSEAYKASIAIATVVLFGTLSMFLYPILFHSGILHLDHTQFGLFAGASIHEVAQVVAAGNQVSVEAGNVAVIVKMTRVLLLIPVLFVLSFYSQLTHSTQLKNKKTIIIPWFAVFFIGIIFFNSLNLLSLSLVHAINQLDIFLLTMAMTAIGLETYFVKIKTAGLKPFLLGTLVFCWLAFFVYFMTAILFPYF